MNIELNQDNRHHEVSQAISDNLGTTSIKEAELTKQENRFCSFAIPAGWKRLFLKNTEAKYAKNEKEKNAIISIKAEKIDHETTIYEAAKFFDAMMALDEKIILREENISFNNDKNEARKWEYETLNDRGILVFLLWKMYCIQSPIKLIERYIKGI